MDNENTCEHTLILYVLRQEMQKSQVEVQNICRNIRLCKQLPLIFQCKNKMHFHVTHEFAADFKNKGFFVYAIVFYVCIVCEITLLSYFYHFLSML